MQPVIRPGHLDARPRIPVLRACLWCVLPAFCVSLLFTAHAQQSQPSSPAGSTAPSGSANRSTASSQIAATEPNRAPQSFDAVNDERRKQIASDSAQLLKLATDLKAEVDKTTKDTLSLTVIRKADEIEHLVHGVKEKMRVASASN